MKIVELNGNGKARDAVMELCQGIETLTNPVRLLHDASGSMPDDFDLNGYIEEKCTYAIDPAYEGSKKRIDQEDGLIAWRLADELWTVRIIERDAWFAAGCLFGMKLAGKPMDEIQKMGLSMVNR